MLSTTPILYCKRAALHYAPDTRPIDPALLPVRNFHSLANLAEPRLLAQGAPTARLFHSQGPSNEVIRASVPFSCTSFHNCACARPWRNGLVQEAQPHDVPDPTPFVRARGGFQATRKQPVYATNVSIRAVRTSTVDVIIAAQPRAPPRAHYIVWWLRSMVVEKGIPDMSQRRLAYVRPTALGPIIIARLRKRGAESDRAARDLARLRTHELASRTLPGENSLKCMISYNNINTQIATYIIIYCAL